LSSKNFVHLFTNGLFSLVTYFHIFVWKFSYCINKIYFWKTKRLIFVLHICATFYITLLTLVGIIAFPKFSSCSTEQTWALLRKVFVAIYRDSVTKFLTWNFVPLNSFFRSYYVLHRGYQWLFQLFDEKRFRCISRKIFCVKIGKNGYQNAQNFMLIPILKTKLRKNSQRKFYFLKTSKRAVFWE